MKEELKETKREDRFFNPKKNLLEEIKNLYENQKSEWKLFRENLKAVDPPVFKEIEIENFKFKVLLNKKRKKSITEDVSKEAMEKRRCFLCPQNLPEEEKGIIFENDYLILVNPYPILKNHFVLSSIKHTPQEILTHIDVLFKLHGEIKDEFFTIYNGPKCGASAPDHFHLQFCSLDGLNILKIYKGKLNEKVFINSEFPINHICINSNSIEELKNLFLKVFKKLENQFNEEPPVNLVLFFKDEIHYLLIFLRKKHRPSCFYGDGKKKILISPGAIDLSGTFITPVEEHFRKVNERVLKEIIDEVIYKKDFLEKILWK